MSLMLFLIPGENNQIRERNFGKENFKQDYAEYTFYLVLSNEDIRNIEWGYRKIFLNVTPWFRGQINLDLKYSKKTLKKCSQTLIFFDNRFRYFLIVDKFV